MNYYIPRGGLGKGDPDEGEKFMKFMLWVVIGGLIAAVIGMVFMYNYTH